MEGSTGQMRLVSSVLLALLLLVDPAGPARADRADRADPGLTLTTTFQGYAAKAAFTVPGDWKGRASGDHVKLTAPSSRRHCSHVLRLRLGLLYVATTVTAPNWVTGRLAGDGPVTDRGDRGDGYSWGVAARKGRRTSTAYGALVAGDGRLGRIMAEVRATSDLTAGCTTSQATPARKRITRVLAALVLQAAAKRRLTPRQTRGPA